jgi:broad-specificity NMP kinase
MSRESHPKTLLVEFVGAAGVGKTVLAEAVGAALTRRELSVQMFRSMAVDPSLLHRVQAFARAAWASARLKPRTLRRFWLQAKNIARHQLRWNSAGSGLVLLCDEGAFHRMRTIFRNSNGLAMKEIADRLVDHMALGDMVVVVTASVEKIQARRVARGKPGDKLDRESVQADVTLLEDSMATISHVKSSGRRLRVLLVDVEEDSLEEATERVVAAVMEEVLRTRTAVPQAQAPAPAPDRVRPADHS